MIREMYQKYGIYLKEKKYWYDNNTIIIMWTSLRYTRTNFMIIISETQLMMISNYHNSKIVINI